MDGAGDNNGSAITGYVVTPYVGTTAQTATTFNSTATSQTVTGLTNATTYTFTVAAKNVNGTGPQSVASGPVTVGAPVAPTGVVGVPGNGSAVVSWTAPATNNGSSITGYVVTPYVGTTAQTATTFNSTATSQTVTGLTNGTTYTFTVAAKNGNGTGPQSVASGAVTVGAPVAPTNVSGSAGQRVGGGVVDGAGEQRVGDHRLRGDAVHRHRRRRRRERSTPTATSQTITGLTNATTYTFTVAAKNGNGTGPQSVASGAVTVGAPVAPTNVSAVPGNGSAVVSWTAPANNGSAITGYVVTPYVGAAAQTANDVQLHGDDADGHGADERDDLHLQGGGQERQRHGPAVGGVPSDQHGEPGGGVEVEHRLRHGLGWPAGQHATDVDQHRRRERSLDHDQQPERERR